jgi:hypothetical protein
VRNAISPFSTVMHRQTIAVLGILLTTLLVGFAARAEPSSKGPRISMRAPAQIPKISELARHLISAGEDQQWEFAAITLDVLLDAYTRELQTSADDGASTPARRAKLARWQRATQGLISQLQGARTRLGQGAPFSLYVDLRHQVLIIVEGQAIVVSGPRSGAEKEISAPVVQHYCAFNDCSFLETEVAAEAEAKSAVAGNWALDQRMRPTYEIGDELRCEFDTLAGRNRKAQLCQQLSVELQRLVESLRQAISQGHTIDWERLSILPPNAGARSSVVVNEEGAYLQIELQLLSRAEKHEWQNMLDWLRRKIDGSAGQLVIYRTGHYLSD